MLKGHNTYNGYIKRDKKSFVNFITYSYLATFFPESFNLIVAKHVEKALVN